MLHHQGNQAYSAFNRTSLESKPSLLAVSASRMRCLLIEPVWNRNSERQIVVGIRFGNF